MGESSSSCCHEDLDDMIMLSSYCMFNAELL